MTITWLGHSCFLLESGGFRALIDPYQGVSGLKDITAEADAVYSSHGHGDHSYTAGVTLTAGKANPFTVEEIPTFHDDAGGAKRGRNTVRRFTAEGLTVVHLGDLGHQLSQAQLAAVKPCDVLLIPVGGFYTIGPAEAKQVADDVAPTVIVPMHYRRGSVGYDVIGPVEDFTFLYPAELVRTYPVNTMRVDGHTPRQVAVPALPR